MDNPFVQHAESQVFSGSPAAALRTARMGLSLFPDAPQLLECAASVAGLLGDDAYALTCWQRLLDLAPAAVAARNSLAATLERLQRIDEAEAVYRQGLAILPGEASLHTNLGLLLQGMGRFEEAESLQRQAMRLAPEAAEIRSNLAGLLAAQGREAEAENLYRAALRLQPEFATAHSNLGVLLADGAREAEAEACFRAALRCAPDFPAARMNLGQLLLRQGRFAEGWPYYEARQHILLESGNTSAGPPPACPQWQGEALHGKAIVVLPEQGLGDELQFARYLPWLKAQGPARLTLVCRPSQQALLQTLEGPDRVLSLSEAGASPDSHDYWTFLLSLPRHAGTTLETIPAGVPYLFPDPARLARHAAGLAGEGMRVGLVWRGNPRHRNDAERSLPDLRVLAPLWAVDGVRFFSLQKSENPLPAPPAGQPLIDLAPAIGDFADTAALLGQLDLLIAVDTAVAHLAGALGVPCWLLLPCDKSDWRWLRERSDSPWYPQMRIFRQQRRGDWEAPVAAMACALQRLAAPAAGRESA